MNGGRNVAHARSAALFVNIRPLYRLYGLAQAMGKSWIQTPRQKATSGHKETQIQPTNNRHLYQHPAAVTLQFSIG